MKLEIVVVPVADVDRAKNFYQALGWREDADFAAGAEFRVVQLTPPGSPCSIIFGTGITSAAPGSAEGLQLTVTDIDAARAELATRGAKMSEIGHPDPDWPDWYAQYMEQEQAGHPGQAMPGAGT